MPKPYVHTVAVKHAQLSAYISTDKEPPLIAAAKPRITSQEEEPFVTTSLAGNLGKSARHASVTATAPAAGHAARFYSIARTKRSSSKKLASTLGQSLRNLFGCKSKPGNGIAVYDINTDKTSMPDGNVLEAHSGIGNMVDNPRYVHIKMDVPTPPRTYNLKIRKSRFHGFVAIRMLPFDGKNKYGRDSLLTHSYLLHGSSEKSHGYVALTEYKRFLTALKQGKVKQRVIVSSNGHERFRLVSNGKSI